MHTHQPCVATSEWIHHRFLQHPGCPNVEGSEGVIAIMLPSTVRYNDLLEGADTLEVKSLYRERDEHAENMARTSIALLNTAVAAITMP